MRAKSEFVHEALADQRRQIRLINIPLCQFPLSKRKTEKSHLIELSIGTYDARSAPNYIALSYTWGPPEPTQAIRIDDKSFAVRKNLWAFLRSYQRIDLAKRLTSLIAPEFLWVDQLCIDQKNDVEKNHQIRMMGEIYSNAHLVIAWLGPSGADSEAVRKYISNAARLDKSVIPSAYEARSIGTFFEQRPYWHRLWIIQELVLARRYIFMCGGWTFRWEDDATGKMQELRIESAMRWEQDFRQRIMQARASQVKGGELFQIIELIHSGRHGWACLRTHDKIFGLMGMVALEKRLEVDYSCSVAQLATQVVSSALPYYKSLSDGLRSRDVTSKETILEPLVRLIDHLVVVFGLSFIEKRGLLEATERLITEIGIM